MLDRFINACLDYFHAHLRKAQTTPCEERHWPSTNFLQKADVHCSIAPENLTRVNIFGDIRSNFRSLRPLTMSANRGCFWLPPKSGFLPKAGCGRPNFLGTNALASLRQ